MNKKGEISKQYYHIYIRIILVVLAFISMSIFNLCFASNSELKSDENNLGIGNQTQFGVVVENSILPSSDKIVGTGSHVKGGYILTCAHLITTAPSINNIRVKSLFGEFDCHDLLFIDYFLDVAILIIDDIDANIGLELSTEEYLSFNSKDLEVLIAERIGDVSSFNKKSIDVKVESEEENLIMKFPQNMMLSFYHTSYEFVPGNSGSVVINPVSNEIMGLVMGTASIHGEYQFGTILPVDDFGHLFADSEKIKGIPVNEIPSVSVVKLKNGQILAQSNLSAQEPMKISGKIKYYISDHYIMEFPIKDNSLYGDLEFSLSDFLIWKMRFDHDSRKSISIYSFSGFERIRGVYKDGMPYGNWKIYNAYGELEIEKPFNEISTFLYFEEMIIKLSVESIFDYKRKGFNFQPSKFHSYFLSYFKDRLDNELLIESLFDYTLFNQFSEERIEKLCNEAYQFSKN
ncbi:MAG: trypsin-like peptidase domain-containing protein [Bacteroidetes bacterium]|nr:trypsin-like peptidase domain-containing protein [Bacteroidota bacterium]